jgi:hypothetical protein
VTPPRIASIAEPPERHADRVVAQMIRFLIAERQRATPAMMQILKTAPDASPAQQARMVERLRAVAGSSIRRMDLKPGKRGKWQISITDWTGWDDGRDQSIEGPGQPLPADPWLACWLMHLKGLGRHRYEQKAAPLLLMKPHAISRGAQRCNVRSIDDVFVLMARAWNAAAALIEDKGEAAFDTMPEAGWRVPMGEETAVLRKHPRLWGTFVLTTMWAGNGAEATTEKENGRCVPS